MAKRFSRRRWRRPERMTLDHGPVTRRKDLGVSEAIPVEPELGRKRSRTHIQTLLGAFVLLCTAEMAIVTVAAGLRWWTVAIGPLFGIVYFVVAREFGDAWIVRSLRARPATTPRVLRLAASEAATARIPAPRVLECSGEIPNACSFALRRRWLVVTDASSALEELELEGMLAHEIIHIRDGDASVASLYVVLAGGPELVLRGAGALCLLSIPIWPVALAMRPLRRVAFPSDREHRADVAAAMLTRYPPGIVEAMRRALRSSGSARGGLRPLDPFWFIPAGRPPGPSAAERAELLAEM